MQRCGSFGVFLFLCLWSIILYLLKSVLVSFCLIASFSFPLTWNSVTAISVIAINVTASYLLFCSISFTFPKLLSTSWLFLCPHRRKKCWGGVLSVFFWLFSSIPLKVSSLVFIFSRTFLTLGHMKVLWWRGFSCRFCPWSILFTLTKFSSSFLLSWTFPLSCGAVQWF